MSMIEQMVETRAWKGFRGITESSQWRLCKKQRVTVQHLLAACKMLPRSEYVARYNRAPMVMAVAWAKETSAIMSMIEQMVETRAWKGFRGITENSQCRLCKKQRVTVNHLLAAWKTLPRSEYVAKYDRAPMVMAVAWAKEQNLLDQNVKWYQEKWNRGHILEISQAKLVWGLEFNLRKSDNI